MAEVWLGTEEFDDERHHVLDTHEDESLDAHKHTTHDPTQASTVHLATQFLWGNRISGMGVGLKSATLLDADPDKPEVSTQY